MEDRSVVQPTGFFDVIIVVRLLFAKLITGKSQHMKILMAVLPIQLLKLFVLGCEPTVAGDINNEQRLSSVIRQ